MNGLIIAGIIGIGGSLGAGTPVAAEAEAHATAAAAQATSAVAVAVDSLRTSPEATALVSAAAAQASTAIAQVTDFCVSYAEFQRIDDGMTKQEVNSLVGSKGKRVTHSVDGSGQTMDAITYPACGKRDRWGTASVVLLDGKVFSFHDGASQWEVA